LFAWLLAVAQLGFDSVFEQLAYHVAGYLLHLQAVSAVSVTLL
jgi:hypothetical protein